MDNARSFLVLSYGWPPSSHIWWNQLLQPLLIKSNFAQMFISRTKHFHPLKFAATFKCSAFRNGYHRIISHCLYVHEPSCKGYWANVTRLILRAAQRTRFIEWTKITTKMMMIMRISLGVSSDYSNWPLGFQIHRLWLEIPNYQLIYQIFSILMTNSWWNQIIMKQSI